MALILLNEPDAFPEASRRRLGRLAEVVTPDHTFDPAEVSAVFVRLAQRIDRDFLARFPALRFVVSPTTGLNHLDLDAMAAAGVRVLSLRGRIGFLDTIRATAEHTLALALALARKLPAADRAVRDGTWNRYPHKGFELSGRTVFILGYGRVGRQVHGLYEAFGARVRACDAVPEKVPADIAVSLDEGLAAADLLSVHVDLTDATAGLIDVAKLDRLPRTARIVNTSRGEILDQNALFERLEDGRLAGAALDVLIGEPDPMDPSLLARIRALGDRLVVTPHISGFTTDSLERVEDFMAGLLEEAWAEAAP